MPAVTGACPLSGEPAGADHRRLATRALALLALIAVPVCAVAALVAGRPGVIGAVFGLGFVALLFAAASASLAWAVDHAPGAALGILLGGAVTRLAVYAVTLSGLSTVTWVHRPSLAIATGIGAALTLAAELVWLARTPRLFHVDAEAARPTAVVHPSPHAHGASTPRTVHHTGSRSL